MLDRNITWMDNKYNNSFYREAHMFDYLMTQDQKNLRDEARAFTKWVPKQLILDMDAEKIQFPHDSFSFE